MEDRIRPIGEVTEGISDGPSDTAQKVHERLRENGGVTVAERIRLLWTARRPRPRLRLPAPEGAKINWYRLFESLIEDFDVDALARRQQVALGEAGL